MRAGRYIEYGGYRPFIPAPLPPDPPIAFDMELIRLLAEAERWLGRLDRGASGLRNADLFVAMYLHKEALHSSEIEGTQSTLEEVLQFEAEGNTRRKFSSDVREIVNYVEALRYGLERLDDIPLSKRLIRQIHAQLLKGTRGGSHSLGNFRSGQNWIGSEGATLYTATFVPPPVPYMHEALDDLEEFLHDTSLPDPIHCGLAHAQLETIHPFWDGNGRVGRLLITLLLVERGVLQRPLLYLSHYINTHKSEYYSRLMDVRNNGNWEGWLKFFLRGIIDVSRGATATTDAIRDLHEQHRSLVAEEVGGSMYALPLLDFLFEYPIVSARLVERRLSSNNVTAANLLKRFETLGLLREITGQKRNRLYRYGDYMDLFKSRGDVAAEEVAASTS